MHISYFAVLVSRCACSVVTILTAAECVHMSWTCDILHICWRLQVPSIWPSAASTMETSIEASSQMCWQDAAQQKRPAKLISGNRRQLHAHLRDQGQSANSAHSQNDRGHGGANGITRQSASAAAIAQPRHAGGPPGMPWMNAHAPPSTHRPPSPPPLPEDPGAYCDTSSVSGGLSRPRRYHANAYLSGARQSSPHTSDHGTHNHGTCVNSGIAFADEQAKLQDEMMKMQMQNDLKRQSMAAKVRCTACEPNCIEQCKSWPTPKTQQYTAFSGIYLVVPNPRWRRPDCAKLRLPPNERR